MAQVWHIRTINGTVPPVPSSLKINRYALDKDSYRSASGKLIRNKITDKMKFEITFAPTTKSELQAILTMLESENFVVQYENILTGALVTGNFYHGDESIEPIWIKNEANTDVLYDKFSINLIEY
jgi:hypothetical protein